MPDKKPGRKVFLFKSFNRGKNATRLVSSGPDSDYNALHILSKDVKKTAIKLLLGLTAACGAGGAIFYFLTH
ncbi:MAG: hypothetical protein US40_C0006G0036 [Candidatus Roizmanbacteria bacterium GW2011_GWC2_37_13]|uniref:Uncharacterized protein n=1 Tax=Candidatus Roizmanbacteria bacterium GW2011_GWC2_37_13 TaxID=1618486 RepID=A0A0G0ING9_9BACT|nr:MAG: hypothetical protein US38_C0010G0039 [Candidatus Roizmanbacteria bacterium GW2011_GWC1_37_12]KKQ25719.1 MAG: hypothetical protein US40_C0006G0036 [Candidatus Roizmanbacteria bacterium GW2011_GWC2_37_13]